jgi:hypothetical protein
LGKLEGRPNGIIRLFQGAYGFKPGPDKSRRTERIHSACFKMCASKQPRIAGVLSWFFGRQNTYNTTVTLYYKNMAFTWWERLPAANIAAAPCCRRLSRLEAAPTKEITQLNPKCRFSNNLPHFIISVLAAPQGPLFPSVVSEKA